MYSQAGLVFGLAFYAGRGSVPGCSKIECWPPVFQYHFLISLAEGRTFTSDAHEQQRRSPTVLPVQPNTHSAGKEYTRTYAGEVSRFIGVYGSIACYRNNGPSNAYYAGYIGLRDVAYKGGIQIGLVKNKYPASGSGKISRSAIVLRNSFQKGGLISYYGQRIRFKKKYCEILAV